MKGAPPTESTLRCRRFFTFSPSTPMILGKEFPFPHFGDELQCMGRFLGLISQIPSVSKSNHLHVVIFRFFFINLRYIA